MTREPEVPIEQEVRGRPNAPSPGPVLAAHPWRSNAELIADCARIGYLNEKWLTLDPTYGRGIWWKTWRPERLVTSDINPDSTAEHVADFTALPWPDEHFDAVAFDPPYVSVGGRKTSTLAPVAPGPVDNSRGAHRRTREGADFHDRYGLVDAAKSPAGVQETICAGLDEVWRVVRPTGFVLVKCQDYISSGRFFAGTHHTLTHALGLGFELIDRLEHLGGVRPQPAHARQVHARRNLSTLFVLRRPR